MVYFNLNLTSSESTFEYSFSQGFLDKNYEIGLVKLDGILEFKNKIEKINQVDENNNAFSGDELIRTDKRISENKYNSNAIDHIFVWCNLIDDSYINNKKTSTIYKFKLDNKEINEEPHQIIYHKVSSRPNKIILRLVDSNSNLIEFDNVNLFVELDIKELKLLNIFIS
jgi:hypothetical protein